MLEDGSYFLAGNDGYMATDYSIFQPDETKQKLEIYARKVASLHFKFDPTGGYLVNYFDLSCDIVGPFVLKLDSDGNQVWGAYLDMFSDVNDIAVFPNGDFLYSSSNGIFKSDNDGQLIWESVLNQTINDIVIDTVAHIYVATENEIIKLDGDGNNLSVMTNEFVLNL